MREQARVELARKKTMLSHGYIYLELVDFFFTCIHTHIHT